MSARPGAPAGAACAACGGCAGAGGARGGGPVARRAFLREAAVAALACALAPADAAALARGAARLRPAGADGQTRTYPVPAADGAAIDRESEVIVVRWQGAVYAFALACPHQNTALRWRDDDRRFQCPKHKSRYRPDGSFIEGRATRGMDRFAVAREGDAVRVDLGRLYRQDRDAAAWAAALVRL